MLARNDVVRLLALAAAYDQRTVGEPDVDAWMATAEVGRWSLQAVRRIIVEHYSSHAERGRLTPADITDRLRKLRTAAAEGFELPRIPDDLPDADWPAWMRARQDEHITAALDRWATTGEEPSRELPAPSMASLPQLMQGAPEEVQAQVVAMGKRIPR